MPWAMSEYGSNFTWILDVERCFHLPRPSPSHDTHSKREAYQCKEKTLRHLGHWTPMQKFSVFGFVRSDLKETDAVVVDQNLNEFRPFYRGLNGADPRYIVTAMAKFFSENVGPRT